MDEDRRSASSSDADAAEDENARERGTSPRRLEQEDRIVGMGQHLPKTKLAGLEGRFQCLAALFSHH